MSNPGENPSILKTDPPKGTPSDPAGEGIRSLKTSGVFRAVNFELYARPNKWIMGFGMIAITGCIGYLAWMKNQHRSQGLYTAMDDQDQLYLTKRKSKWD